MSQPSKPTLSSASIEWNEQGQPISTHFDDVYFSKTSGLEESRYVFLQHNQLHERFTALKPRQHFTIAETGFGTGLNFLAAWQLWQQQACSSAHLQFISVEKHPLTQQDLTQALSLWPDLAPLSQTLISAYPPSCNGFYRLKLSNNVSLTLLFGDAIHCFSQLQARVDAWFLDGFAPSKNPDMWTPQLFHALASLSHEGTTFSTFTAAGTVRRELQDAGFNVKKDKGFGRKREMIYGCYTATLPPVTAPSIPSGYQLPQVVSLLDEHANTPNKPNQTIENSIVVVGAGIAGCSTARALAEKGFQVTLIDRHSDVAREASGNPQGVLYAKLPAIPTKESRLHWAGLAFSLRELNRLIPHWKPSGVLQLATTDAELRKHNKLVAAASYPEKEVQAITAEQASSVAGIRLNYGGLWFPKAGWVNPKDWCQKLVDHPNINRLQLELTDIKLEQGRWKLTSTSSKLETHRLILCCANQAKQFALTQWLPTKAIRGQISVVRPDDSSPEAAANNALKTVLCGKGYICPPVAGNWSFGATFNLHESTSESRPQDHQQNLEHIEELSNELSSIFQKTPKDQWQGRVAFRCTTPDYLPIVGPVPDISAFVQTFKELRDNAKATINSPVPYLPGLYVNIGHGSKGLITAPLSAEFLANHINGEPLPLESDLINALLPARFIVKKLIQKSI